MAARGNKLSKATLPQGPSKISSFFSAGATVNWGSVDKAISSNRFTGQLTPEEKTRLSKPQRKTFELRAPIFSTLNDVDVVTLGMVASMPTPDFRVFETIAKNKWFLDLDKWSPTGEDIDRKVEIAVNYNRVSGKRYLSLWDVLTLPDSSFTKFGREIDRVVKTNDQSASLDINKRLADLSKLEAQIATLRDRKLDLELKVDLLKSQLSEADKHLAEARTDLEVVRVLVKNAPLVKVKTLRTGVRHKGWIHTDPKMPPQCVAYLLEHPEAYAHWMLFHRSKYYEPSWWRQIEQQEAFTEVEALAQFSQANLAIFQRTYRENFQLISEIMQADDVGFASKVPPLKARKEIKAMFFEGKTPSPQTMQLWRENPRLYTEAMFERDCFIRECVWPLNGKLLALLSGEQTKGYARKKKKKTATKGEVAKVVKKVERELHKKKKRKGGGKGKKSVTPIGPRKNVIPGVVRAIASDVGEEVLFRGVDETDQSYSSRVIEYNGNDIVILPCSHKYFAVAAKALKQLVPAELTALLTTYNRCQWGSLSFVYEAAASAFKGGEMGMIFVPLENGEPTSETINSLFNTRMLVKSPDHVRVPATARYRSMTVPHIGGSRPIHGPEGVIGWFIIYPREPAMSLNSQGEATDAPYTGLMGHITVRVKSLGQYRTNVTSDDNGLFSTNEFSMVAEPYVWKAISRSDGSQQFITPVTPIAPPSVARAISNTELVGGALASTSESPGPYVRKQIVFKRNSEDFVMEIIEILIAVIEVISEVAGELPSIMKVVASGVELFPSIVNYAGAQFADKVAVVQQANHQNSVGILQEGFSEGFVTTCRANSRGLVNWTDAFEAFMGDIGMASSPWKSLWTTITDDLKDRNVAPMAYCWDVADPVPEIVIENTVFESNLDDYPVVKTVPFPADLTPSQRVLSNSDYTFLPWNVSPSIPNRYWRPTGGLVNKVSRGRAYSDDGTPHVGTYLIFEPQAPGGDFTNVTVTFAHVSGNGTFSEAFFQTRENFWAVWGIENEPQNSSDPGVDSPTGAIFTVSYRTIGCISAASAEFVIDLPPYGPGSGAVENDATPQGVLTGIIARGSTPEVWTINFGSVCELFAKNSDGDNFDFYINDTNRTVIEIRSDF